MELCYIGFNSNNAVGNNFAATITLYPTGEQNNIYYSDTPLSDITSCEFYENYKEYILNEYRKIKNKNFNAVFISFNKKIKEICKKTNEVVLFESKTDEIVDFLNNKEKCRNLLSNNSIPMLDYIWVNGNQIKYSDIIKSLDTNKLVLQGVTGAGGDTTFLVENEEEFNNFIVNNKRYCISKYIKNTPINITCIIGENGNIKFPMSAQLIKVTEHKFKYVGADFITVNDLNAVIKNRVDELTDSILNVIRKEGYLGIIGIDYILDENDNLYFMEINPRFQSSSFLINNELSSSFNTDIAHLHYQAVNRAKIHNLHISNINYSFLNCNLVQDFNNINCDYDIYKYGYFEKNKESVYRKIYKKSIISLDSFEKRNS